MDEGKIRPTTTVSLSGNSGPALHALLHTSVWIAEFAPVLSITVFVRVSANGAEFAPLRWMSGSGWSIFSLVAVVVVLELKLEILLGGRVSLGYGIGYSYPINTLSIPTVFNDSRNSSNHSEGIATHCLFAFGSNFGEKAPAAELCFHHIFTHIQPASLQ